MLRTIRQSTPSAPLPPIPAIKSSSALQVLWLPKPHAERYGKQAELSACSVLCEFVSRFPDDNTLQIYIYIFVFIYDDMKCKHTAISHRNIAQWKWKCVVRNERGTVHVEHAEWLEIWWIEKNAKVICTLPRGKSKFLMVLSVSNACKCGVWYEIAVRRRRSRGKRNDGLQHIAHCPYIQQLIMCRRFAGKCKYICAFSAF